MRRFFRRLRALWTLSAVTLRNDERGLYPVVMSEPAARVLAQLIVREIAAPNRVTLDQPSSYYEYRWPERNAAGAHSKGEN